MKKENPHHGQCILKLDMSTFQALTQTYDIRETQITRDYSPPAEGDEEEEDVPIDSSDSDREKEESGSGSGESESEEEKAPAPRKRRSRGKKKPRMHPGQLRGRAGKAEVDESSSSD